MAGESGGKSWKTVFHQLLHCQLSPGRSLKLLLLVLIQVHVFVAGYLFTTSMISVDPLPHRAGYLHRAVVLVIALAGHDILAKYLDAHPPDGVPAGPR